MDLGAPAARQDYPRYAHSVACRPKNPGEYMKRVLLFLMAAIVATFISIVASSPAAHATTCGGGGTTFNPPAPQGAGMTQTYKNCDGHGVWVMPYLTMNGSISIYDAECHFVADGDYTSWSYSWTVANAVYSTAFCIPPYPPSARSTYSSDQCWTHFDPAGPNGAPMTQDYFDCNYYSYIRVAPGYTGTNGSFYGYESSCVAVTPVDLHIGGAEWFYTVTVPGARYTTTYCLGTTP
jgi:hypothetical protein